MKKQAVWKKWHFQNNLLFFWEEYHFCFLLLLQEPIHSLCFMYFCVQCFSWSRDDWSDKCSGGKKTVFHSWDKREKTWADFITAMRIWIHFQHCQCFLFFRKVRQTWLQKSDMHSINSISVCVCVCVCKTH